VSVVVGAEAPVVEPDGAPEPSAALDAIAGASPGYRWSQPRGRPVLYPGDEPWAATVAGVAITDRPRIDAAEALLGEIRRQLPELGLIGGVVRKGDPSSPVFTDRVSVEGDAPAVEHLAALLDDDRALAFAIDRGAARSRVLWFQRVGSEGAA